ncbi:MAG: hypothetical protein A2V67_00320 [Deltaproteobacteria bacterium RBG_13_61_14]|nr:MAG: hypothetical protein A2V67_00320 [Deltaproteobacteria bacterium RBG_13_61_14]
MQPASAVVNRSNKTITKFALIDRGLVSYNVRAGNRVWIIIAIAIEDVRKRVTIDIPKDWAALLATYGLGNDTSFKKTYVNISAYTEITFRNTIPIARRYILIPSGRPSEVKIRVLIRRWCTIW